MFETLICTTSGCFNQIEPCSHIWENYMEMVYDNEYCVSERCELHSLKQLLGHVGAFGHAFDVDYVFPA